MYNKEELNKAAYAETDTGNPFEQFGTWEVREAFKNGVKWLLSRPLSERLTEEEEKKLRNYYKENTEGRDPLNPNDDWDDIQILEEIFSKEFFNHETLWKRKESNI